jgi:uncharacterized SAM-dependent methyltransferase
LDGNFDINSFDHDPSYNASTGAAISHILSLKDQKVTIGSIGKEFSFQKGERIFTEISQKYSIEEIDTLALVSGFHVVENFFDSNGYFVDTLWEVK